MFSTPSSTSSLEHSGLACFDLQMAQFDFSGELFLLNMPVFAGHTTGQAVFPHPTFKNGLLRPEAKVSVRPALPA